MKEELKVPRLRFKEFSGEWEIKRLIDLGELIGGGTPSKEILSYWVGNIPWISSSDIRENNIHNINITKFINTKSIKESATKLIPKGSILFISRVGVGKLAINNQALCTSQDFTNFIPKKVNSFFLGYFFIGRKDILQRLSQGTSIQGFVKSDLATKKIALPSLPEQEKIATFLTSVDKKIDQLSNKKSLLEKYKKAAMQKLFSQEIRFKKDNGEPYPDWEEKKLEESIDYTKGFAFKSEQYRDQGVRIIRVSDLAESSIKVNNKKLYISKISEENYTKYKIIKGNIIITTVGSHPNLMKSAVGRGIYISEDNVGLLNQNMLKLNNNLKVNNRFIYCLINTSKYISYIKGIKRGNANQSNITVKELLLYKINLPSLPEQEKIANFLTSIDNKIEQTTKQLEQAKTFKKGLLQQMFI